MQRIRRALRGGLGLGILALVACGDGEGDEPDYSGVYEVTLHTETEDGCGGPGVPVAGLGYFSLESESFLGTPILGWYDCESATSCSDATDLTRSFAREDGAWSSTTVFASSGGAGCFVSLVEGTISADEVGVIIEYATYNGSFDVADDDCSTDFAETHRDELVCETLEVIEARRL